MKFWELFKEGYVIQGFITLIFCVTIVTLLMLQRPVPDYVVGFVFTILGYYFGSKSQAKINGK